jgi:hypothetical protein
MDFLKTGVTLRAYGQKNPLTEYKLEGYQVFLKMMSRVRRNAVYNVFLFTPRKLTPMSQGRIASLIPNREQRRRMMQEMGIQKPAEESVPEVAGIPVGVQAGPGARSLNLAKLALNVRQLLDARESLQELALASFGELKEQFNRAGLYLLGDQLRWAQACTDFEWLEDETSGEIYIGVKGRASGETTPAESSQKGQAMSALQDVMDNPEFMKTIDQFTAKPEDFLAQMKQAADEQGWTPEDIAKMRQMYQSAGIDIDAMVKQMTDSSEDLPEAQKEVVEYMQRLLSSDQGGDGADGKEKEAAKEKLKV